MLFDAHSGGQRRRCCRARFCPQRKLFSNITHHRVPNRKETSDAVESFRLVLKKISNRWRWQPMGGCGPHGYRYSRCFQWLIFPKKLAVLLGTGGATSNHSTHQWKRKTSSGGGWNEDTPESLQLSASSQISLSSSCGELRTACSTRLDDGSDARLPKRQLRQRNVGLEIFIFPDFYALVSILL